MNILDYLDKIRVYVIETPCEGLLLSFGGKDGHSLFFYLSCATQKMSQVMNKRSASTLFCFSHENLCGS